MTINTQRGSSRTRALSNVPAVAGDHLDRAFTCVILLVRTTRARPVPDPGSSPVVVGDAVFVQGDRRLASVDLKTGKATWTARLDLNRPRYTSLIAADGKAFYAFDGLLCFAASADAFQPLMQAVIDRNGLLAEEEAFRRKLGIDELERTAEGQKEAEQLWKKEIGSGHHRNRCDSGGFNRNSGGFERKGGGNHSILS